MSRDASSSNPVMWWRRWWAIPAVVTVSSLVVGLAACGAAPATRTTPTPAHGSTSAQQAQLARLVRELVEAGAPGVIVRVDDGEDPPVEIAQQAGWTQQDGRLEVGNEFRMGSNTKTMLATLALQLVAEGKIALNDPVEKWLPGQVPNGDAITLRMVLNHTSGLIDYTEDPALLGSILGKDGRQWSSAELIAVVAEQEALFAPGTRWAYSNTDYAVVGAVLEQATGSNLTDLIRERITAPLNLRNTYLATDGTWQGRYAHGYEADSAHMPEEVPAEYREVAGVSREGHVDVSGNSPSWGGAAGGVVSTAPDWARFFAALMSGALLPADQLGEMRTTIAMNPDNPDGPRGGLGIQTVASPCGTVWVHEGGITGYSSVNITDETGRRSASVLVSTSFAFEFGGESVLSTKFEELYLSSVCAMFGRTVPTE